MANPDLILKMVQDLEKERDKVNKAIKSLLDLVDSPQQLEISILKGHRMKRGRKKSTVPTHADIAIEVLREHGNPLKTKMIMDKLREKGQVVAGTMSLFATLDRCDAICKTAPGTWGLVEKQSGSEAESSEATQESDGGVPEMENGGDLKSSGVLPRVGSNPTTPNK